MDVKSEPIIKNEREDPEATKEPEIPDTGNVKSEINNTEANDEDSNTQEHIEGECTPPEVKTVDESEENEGVEICRLCACDIVDTAYCIFENTDISFYEKINFSLPITVNVEDEMPSYICEGCKNTLEEVYIFASKVSIANEDLKIR